jgi:hypothetical protein
MEALGFYVDNIFLRKCAEAFSLIYFCHCRFHADLFVFLSELHWNMILNKNLRLAESNVCSNIYLMIWSRNRFTLSNCNRRVWSVVVVVKMKFTDEIFLLPFTCVFAKWQNIRFWVYSIWEMRRVVVVVSRTTWGFKDGSSSFPYPFKLHPYRETAAEKAKQEWIWMGLAGRDGLS